MKKTQYLSVMLIISLLIIFGFVLTGCSSETTPLTTKTSAPVATDAAATEEQITTDAPIAAAGDCLVGSWNLTDFSAYMESIKNNISMDSGGDVTFTSGDFSGSATFTFNADNTSKFVTDNFSQSFTMAMNITDQTMELPITLTINGASSADYADKADQITFSNQNCGDMLITVDIAGTASSMDESMFGEPGTQKLYQYDCVDANTLSLKVIAVESMDLAPMILTRVD
ncbi:MAG: hypothetical protein CVU42_01035 [Chloroflexi bacterium HGW-Chloroflexi-4]|jgi:hypothetical protein|nr:MAG: hypothetical protein CVU42_01035 [Chloroflexi bacterium HGW-Chloroflexi-4]